jgi:hypothetical protein
VRRRLDAAQRPALEAAARAARALDRRAIA